MPFRWTESLSVGNDAIDAQHRVLIERVALLGAALDRGELGAVAPMVAYLGDYALGHFEEEERIMRERSYPGYAEHNAAHLAFVGRFLEVERELQRGGPNAEAARRLQAWLAMWLEEHIAGEDQQLGQFLRRRAAQRVRARAQPRPSHP
jgi:hemerythrin